MCDLACARLNLDPRQTRVIVQGFGNVGSNAAALLAAACYRGVGIYEYDGGVLHAAGLDIRALLAGLRCAGRACKGVWR